MNYSLSNTKSNVLSRFDPDAKTYIVAVETADGQSLESGVKTAINNFVVGCKTDGVWNAIKSSCILSGARTLAGALVPLKGSAPTNFNFVSGDYNRKTGLLGNNLNKYLDTNRNNNADPQNNKHLIVWKSFEGAAGSGLLGTPTFAVGGSWIFDNTSTGNDTMRVNSSASVLTLSFPSTGFIGASRSSSTSFNRRYSSSTVNVTNSSTTQLNENITVLRAGGQYSSSRVSFYSLGESLDLSLIDSRLTSLIAAYNSAIP